MNKQNIPSEPKRQSQIANLSDTAHKITSRLSDEISDLLSDSTDDTNDPVLLMSELEELTRTKERLILHADRMERYLKEQLRKNRTSRLIHWGAELKHRLHLHAPDQKSALEQISQDQQKDFMQRLFDDEDIREKILQLLLDIL